VFHLYSKDGVINLGAFAAFHAANRAIRSNFCSAKIPLLSLARAKAFGFRLPKTAKAVLIPYLGHSFWKKSAFSK
jgi:hypothetical protein